MFWLGFIIGIFAGCFAGVLIMSLMAAVKRGDYVSKLE